MKKVNSLLTQDCKILVISDKVNTQLANYIKQKKIDFKKTKLKDGDFLSKYKPFLVMAATDDRRPAMARKLKLQAEKIFKKIIKKEDIYQIKLQQIARDAAKKIIPTQLERKKF